MPGHATGQAVPRPAEDAGAGGLPARLHKALRHGEDGGRGWPYERAFSQPLPPTLPDGSPWPRISVVTPSYNHGDFIEETILSVANQDYPNVEHIVMDGGSTDATGAVLARYEERIAVVVSEPDRGQSHAINKGMARATGEIVTWLNSDDRLAPGALAAVALAFHMSRADIVAGVAEIHVDGRIATKHVTSCSNGPLPLDDLLDLQRCWYAGQFFYQPEVMFTRELWERAGGYVDESLHYSMDYELWVRFASVGARLNVIGSPVAEFRVHAGQKTYVAERFKAELDGLNAQICLRLGKTPAGGAPDEGKRLRATFLNDVGFNYGAGIAHQRLAQALASAGAAVTALSLQEGLQPPPAHPGITDIAKALEATRPDIVVVGNLHGGGVDAKLLGAVSERWPTFVVLHDFWLLTGRCAYPGDCSQYLAGCTATCGTAAEYPVLAPPDIAPAWRGKRELLESASSPTLLANSLYTEAFARRALESSGRKPAVEAIRLGVPTETFAPRDKAEARRALDLDADAFIVMVAASAVDDPRKGSDIVRAVLSRVQVPNVLVVAAGWHDPAQSSPMPNLRRIGYVNDPARMALLYAAADVLLAPSRDETFGQVFVEAAACGTPSVSFNAAGMRDAIRDGISGVLVPPLSVDGLATTLEQLASDPEARHRMAALGPIFAANEYSMARSAQSFMAMLVRTGLADRLRLPRRTSLADPLLSVTCSVIPGRLSWTPQEGFCAVEGALAAGDTSLPQACHGRLSRFSVDTARAGTYLLDIAYVNRLEGQRVALTCNGARMGDYRLAVGAGRLTAPISLVAGANDVTMVFRKRARAANGARPEALVVTDVAVERHVSEPAVSRLRRLVRSSPVLRRYLGPIWRLARTGAKSLGIRK